MNSTTISADADVLVQVNRGYSDFCAFATVRTRELGEQAGALALKALLNTSDTGSREHAIQLKYELNGLELALQRIDGEWRNRESPLKFVKAAYRMLISNRDYYTQEAGQYSLRIIDSDPAGTAYAEGQINAMRSHQAAQAHQSLLTKFEETFGQLLCTA